MGFRFRRSISILPGLKLNFSKSGISTSVGGRGATINFSKRGTRTTVGLPGTGLSYSTLSSADPKGDLDAPTAGSGTQKGGGCAILLIAVIVIAALSSIFGTSKKQASPIAENVKPTVEKLKVAATALNCRSGPTTSERRIASLSNGQTVTVADPTRKDGWVKLDIAGTQCWALERHLAPMQ